MPARRVFLLGVPIDAVSPDEAVLCLQRFLAEPAQRFVATPNNEMLVVAARNPAFRSLLKSAALNLPDSTGLLLAARVTKQFLPVRVTGVDTVQSLCAGLDGEHPVFLLGAAPGVAERAAAALRAWNSRLVIAGTYAGSPRPEDAEGIISRINASGAHLLLVAYGTPRQEQWITQCLHRMSSVRVAIGVGGAFDFLSGAVPRAPVLLRAVGFEWLWRLALQPWRIGRIWNATIVFSFLVARYGRNEPV